VTAEPIDVPMFAGESEFSGEVHPFAALFPMLPADQLQDLADDIKAHGQLSPILLDPDGRLIDGRNRLAACDMAGVRPVFDVVDSDPVSVIVSANAKRRHMTAGQRVMAVAWGMWEQGLWDSDAGRWKRGKQGILADSKFLATEDLARAGTILAFSTELALDVLHARRSLRATYDHVRNLQAESAEYVRKHAELEANARELLQRIDQDFTFDMAYAAYQERDKKRIKDENDRAEAARKFNGDLRASIHYLAPLALHEKRREQVAQDLDPEGPTEVLSISDVDCTQAIASLELIRITLKERRR
jgi:hypothetical protein